MRALTRVKGIGKKTAERIVVELRDVMTDGVATPALKGAGGVSDAIYRDAIAALEALGIDGMDARRRIEKASAAAPGGDVADLVRAALRG